MTVIKNENKIFVPDYLNKEFFVTALEEGLREVKVNIHEINFTWGSNPGDNYCSSIYRVLIDYDTDFGQDDPKEKQQISLIVKTIPITSETQFLEDVGVFVKEKLTYWDVLPRLAILSNGDKFGANCFYATKSPVQTIVFNDLKVDGFTVASRQDGLDWNHSTLILQQLAKFHATSMVLAKKDPAITKRFQKGMLCEETVLKTDTFFQMFGGYLGQLVKSSSTWPGYQNISNKLQKYYNNFKEITYKLGKAKEGDRYQVLNHGDMWTNNFMYAYEDKNEPNKPTKAIFVDFQLSFYGSPGCDLNFFLNTSVQLDILKTRRDDLIEIYYKNFAETLDYMRYENIPSLDDLKYELRSRELYGLFGLFGFLPMVTLPKELSEDTSIEAFTNQEYKNKKLEEMFGRKELTEILKYSLKRLEDLGVLDEFKTILRKEITMTISYSEDIGTKPKHLDLNLFTDILENALFRNNFEIKTIDFTMGSSTGENYCSQIYRVKVSYKSTNALGKDGCISVIIKSMPHSEATDFLIDLNVFLKEKVFYNNVLPCLEVLCKDNVKFAPRLYHSLKLPIKTLIFEDLGESKFEMASREKGLDLKHCLMVMNKLGKFHAASLKLFKKVPEYQTCFHSGMLADDALNKDEGMIMTFFGNNMRALIDLTETWKGYEKINEKMKKYERNLRNNLRRGAAVEENAFCVLNHGDLWVNNILFKYDDQRNLVDLNFVDFQMSVWNSPGIDLNYFFYTSLELDILKNKLDLLIKEYHKSLSETMQDLGYKKIPSYYDIYNEVQKRQLYGFFAHYGVFPVICQDKEQSHDSNLENFKNEDFAKQKLKQVFASKRLQETYRYTLEKFDKMGIFD
ncbi:uncharacterized protein ACRADG_007038 [Cochliomyia hominivorax]